MKNETFYRSRHASVVSVFKNVPQAAAVKFLSNADLVMGTELLSRATVLTAWALLALVATASARTPSTSGRS